MLNGKWCIEVEASIAERIDDFLSSMGYNIFIIGESRATSFIYFHNHAIGSTIKYGRSIVGMMPKTNFIEFKSIEELIDAHFNGVNNEEL